MLGAKPSKLPSLPSNCHMHCNACNNPLERKEPIRPAYNNIFEAIGNTPLVKLNKIPHDNEISSDVEIYVKCEFMNPGGSIKDRVGFKLVQDQQWNIKEFLKGDPSRQVLEPTSGNTGIGIAANCTFHGFKCKILTTHKCSSEKVNTMRLLGAEIEYTKQGESKTKKGHEMMATGTYFMLDQFNNRVNPLAHYDGTAEEIIRGLAYKRKRVDYLVCSSGSGGTMTGTARRLKDHNRAMKLIAVDIEGSQQFHQGSAHPFQVEGISAHPNPPLNLDKDVVDDVVVVSDRDAFLTAREMAKKEGILCGGSGGMAVKAALIYAQTLERGVIVVIIPDGIRNSMTKFVSDPWMEAHLYKPPPERNNCRWYNAKLEELLNCLPDNHQKEKIFNVCTENSGREVLEKMIEKKSDVALVYTKESCEFVGVVSLNSIRHELTDPDNEKVGRAAQQDQCITEYMDPDVQLLDRNYDKAIVGLVSRILDIRRYVVVGDAEYYPYDNNNPDDKVIKKLKPHTMYVVTAEDLASFIQEYEYGFGNRRQLDPCCCNHSCSQ